MGEEIHVLKINVHGHMLSLDFFFIVKHFIFYLAWMKIFYSIGHPSYSRFYAVSQIAGLMSLED